MVSNFKELIKQFFRGVTLRFTETVNGEAEQPNYLHDQVLTEDYSHDMTYETLSGENTNIMADFVAFDAPMPLKSRDSQGSAKGEIIKIGTARTLNEKQMNTLRILSNDPRQKAQLVRKFFEDVRHCITGVKELLDYATYKALSSGISLMQDVNTAGIGVRIDYGVPAENNSNSDWTLAEAKPIDDIKRIIKQAKDNGTYLRHIWMGSDTIDILCKNTQIREMFGALNGYAGNVSYPELAQEQLENYFSRALRLTIHVKDRMFVAEVNGERKKLQGWEEGMVSFTEDTNIGRLVYSTLAEEAYPQKDVDYQKSGNYILIAKSGDTDPVSEKTTSQAIAMPVIDAPDRMFFINTLKASDDSDDEESGSGDNGETDSGNGDKIAILGTEYTREQVIEALTSLGVQGLDENSTVEDVTAILDTMNDKDKGAVVEEIK